MFTQFPSLHTCCPGHHCKGLWATPLGCRQSHKSLQDYWATISSGSCSCIVYMPASPLVVLSLVSVCAPHQGSTTPGWGRAGTTLVLLAGNGCAGSNLGNKQINKLFMPHRSQILPFGHPCNFLKITLCIRNYVNPVRRFFRLLFSVSLFPHLKK